MEKYLKNTRKGYMNVYETNLTQFTCLDVKILQTATTFWYPPSNKNK
jgi:hypothetical protein